MPHLFHDWVELDRHRCKLCVSCVPLLSPSSWVLNIGEAVKNGEGVNLCLLVSPFSLLRLPVQLEAAGRQKFLLLENFLPLLGPNDIRLRRERLGAEQCRVHLKSLALANFTQFTGMNLLYHSSLPHRRRNHRRDGNHHSHGNNRDDHELACETVH